MIGWVVAEISDENIREISLYAYRIIYQLMDEQVFILAIAHKRQNLKKHYYGVLIICYILCDGFRVETFIKDPPVSAGVCSVDVCFLFQLRMVFSNQEVHCRHYEQCKQGADGYAGGDYHGWFSCATHP